MQVNLGEKIRELRKRDGRKQEDLASALGVTPQAVSRWEANGGYPDMGMIPAIANYFYITIDELFGYDNDREQRIQEYNDQAILMMTEKQNMQECILLLRKGLEEFPTEARLKKHLANALVFEGWKQEGGNHKEAKPNPYWEEAVALFEELVDENPDLVLSLVDTYALLGQIEKAEQRAKQQQSVSFSREVLLAKIFDAQKGREYRGEAVLALLQELRFAIETSIALNEELLNSREALEILTLERQMLEKILGEDCFGYHNELCFIDSQRVRVACNLKDYMAALEYFDMAYDQYMKSDLWSKQVRNRNEEATKQKTKKTAEGWRFSTAMLRDVNSDGHSVCLFEKNFLADCIQNFPEELAQQIKKNPKYSSLF